MVFLSSPSSGRSDSWLDPLTDSSYDSLENELDNSSGGSPGFCSRRRLTSKPLQGSLDSILTFSDHDTDPDTHQTQTDSPQGLKMPPLGRTRGQRQGPDASCPSKDAPTADTSSTLDPLPLGARHRQRRRSEPAIAYTAKFGPCVPGEDEGEDDDEELSEKPSSHTLAHTHTGSEIRKSGGKLTLNLHGVRSAALEASSSSLSSNPTSPAPTASSLDSPDSLRSLSGDHTWVTRRGLHPTKTHLPSSSSSVPSSVASTTFTISQDAGTCPKDPPPKEPVNWGTLKGCRGLHPNSWLKKGRRLSLTQQDNLEKEDEDKAGVSLITICSCSSLIT